ncbi:unnamed protein product [Nezara viridula]|uniref:Uncharacterized protein n=1 Tax=Nezara viridula TaxID=85310 RepID=A0A9P0HPV9_NEZVI|nr:unnamed protein product [Nezara viridula]
MDMSFSHGITLWVYLFVTFFKSIST